MPNQKISQDDEVLSLNGCFVPVLDLNEALPADQNKRAAPSLFAPLNGKASRSLIFSKGLTLYSVTGTTNETIVSEAGSGILIPANTVKPGDILRVVFVLTKSVANGGTRIIMKTNISNQLSGAVLLTDLQVSATIRWIKVERDFLIKESTTEGMSTNATSANTDVQSNTQVINSVSIDWTIDQYLMLSVANVSSSDTVTLRNWYAEIIR